MLRLLGGLRPFGGGLGGHGHAEASASMATPPAWGQDRSGVNPDVAVRQELAALRASLDVLRARLDALVSRSSLTLPQAPVAPAPPPSPPAPATPAPAPAAEVPHPHEDEPGHVHAGPPAPEAPATPGSGPQIRHGSRGHAVTRLQERLRDLGIDPGPIDGLFGPLTEAAVREFQARHGLEVDGIVGPQTWGALGVVVEAPSPPPPGTAGEPIANWRAHITQHWKGAHSQHRGVDIGVPTGTSIMAVKDGEVVYSQFNHGGFGNLVALRHDDGTFTLYAHAHELRVGVGQHVRAGEEIATVGSTGQSTGPHLHFEAREGSALWTATNLDPVAYLGGI